MTIKLRKIEIDAATAEVLEARAAARGMSVSELLETFLDADDGLPPEWEAMRAAGQGP
jgi:hypothetical protein